ncbi:MAG: Bax inhibitor-1/YccA family protein [Saprospirales bacterium]|nr:Bax inhibitor-1/YccA family protein [Saprospirales bacterium]MBK8490707.1 Bax inhibitor-1/YccA family protein [Saprospirales bacterium]
MAQRNLFSSGNPVLSEDTYRKSAGVATDEAMTVRGAVQKTFLLTAVLVVVGVWSFMNANPMFIWIGAIGGLIAVLVAVFKKEWSPVLAPVYAALEGLALGAITAIYAAAYDGIVFNAITLTVAILLAMLFLYQTRIIKVTEKFRSGVIMATMGIFLVYLVDIVLSMFHVNVPFLHEGGFMGIGISLFIVGVASLNLLLDFDQFEKGEQYGAPKYMEWFSALGLLVTLVWLYLEILRLLSKLRD